MAVDRDDPRLKFKPMVEAIVPPPGIIMHYKDYWWCVDPERGLIFWAPRGRSGSAQCNRNPEITKKIVQDMYPWAEAVQIPSVFWSVSPSDYV